MEGRSSLMPADGGRLDRGASTPALPATGTTWPDSPVPPTDTRSALSSAPGLLSLKSTFKPQLTGFWRLLSRPSGD